ncbi:AraC family transcriptional regulator [Herbiconiux sp. CPCC 205763]|uniref:AraC family transcriptional regulator n=1 Tax=Herbiconiux aconitum TaxID=2970913 RepID=A0ABT2GRJ9_9MICO|nr:AraC family transcriptional regulator [Herbiconiux aconitum]MCS5718808.1 AraC family transcriptional regulator [Herbiconiux aconitum]
MAADRLSEVLDFIEVRSVVSGGSAVRGRWHTHSVIDDDLKFIAVVQGSVTLATDGIDAPLVLAPGDVAVLNGRSWLTLDGGEGPEEPQVVEPPSAGSMIDEADADAADVDILIGGRVDLNPTGKELLLRTLPAVAHVGASSAVGPQLRGHVQRLFSEIVARQVGADFAIRQYGQLLVLDIIRGFIQDTDMPAGWMKALTDERLRPALALIHEQPAKSWSLEDLARAASMSRTTFAQRFRDIAGTPPLTYLINWRMLLAQRELRGSDTRVGALAFTLGYSSESAFSSAFKRHLGESPLAYRTRARQEASLTSGQRGLT